MYQEELQALSGVRRELDLTVREKSSLQMELTTLEGKYRVMETLRDSQQAELQSLKVARSGQTVGRVFRIGVDLFQTFPSPPPLPRLQVTLSVQESTLNRVQGSLRDAQEEIRSLRELVARQEDELHAGEMERRRLHNTVQELKVRRRAGRGPGVPVFAAAVPSSSTRGRQSFIESVRCVCLRLASHSPDRDVKRDGCGPRGVVCPGLSEMNLRQCKKCAINRQICFVNMNKCTLQ